MCHVTESKKKSALRERRMDWNTINNINADISQMRIKQTTNNRASRNERTMSNKCCPSDRPTVRYCCYCRPRRRCGRRRR